MATAVDFFQGYNSHGVSVQVAIDATGRWFDRAYEFNGRGRAWSRWTAIEPRTIEMHGEHARIECGFTFLSRRPVPERTRLPK